MYNEHEELNLGDIMSDAYVYAVENSEYYDGRSSRCGGCSERNSTYFIQRGCHGRTGLQFIFTWNWEGWAGGLSADQPYLTGKELKLVAEIDASVSDFMTIARLYCSGLNFT